MEVYALLEMCDEIAGKMLDPMLVQKSRRVELHETWKHSMYYRMERKPAQVLANKSGKTI